MLICEDCDDYEINMIFIFSAQVGCVDSMSCRSDSPKWNSKYIKDVYKFCGWCGYEFKNFVRLSSELVEICCDDYKSIMGEILHQQMTCNDNMSCRNLGPKFDGKYRKYLKYCPWCGGKIIWPPPGHRQDRLSNRSGENIFEMTKYLNKGKKYLEESKLR